MFAVKCINNVGYKRFTNKNNLKKFPTAIFNIYMVTVFTSGCVGSLYEAITNESDNIVDNLIMGGFCGATIATLAPIIIPIAIIRNIRHKLNE